MEALDDRDWRRLVHTIQRGTCMVLLGPDAATDADDPNGLPLAQHLAETLAAKLPKGAAPPDRDDLPSVAQTFEAARGRIELEMEVEDFCGRFSKRITPLHEDLAALPIPVYINTAPDPALANALRAVGRAPRTAHYDFKRAQGFVLPDPTPEYPWIYDLYGSLAEPQSLVLTERDLLDYLVNVIKGAPPLPAALISRFRDPDTSLLFVCFGFRRWHLRILLHVLRSYEPPNNPNLALEDGAFYTQPDLPQTVVFFDRAHRICFRQAACGGFAAKLRERYQPLAEEPVPPRLEPAADAPVLFLSYTTEDHAAVERLAERLQAEGLRIWLDRQNLRGGDRWEQLIPDVIKRQVDYVLVLQTPQLLARVESYVYREIEESLARQSTFAPKLRFLIPVRMEPDAQIDGLSQLHFVDLTTPRGLDDLVAAIREDWQRRAGRKGSAP
ncbi:toll/interleukin-1 receptor domain-containing protein [Rhabdochromatium marinum]|uniref:toll/interleukin-1 receptor domain-containing protein n=1 Tax=Rhabdochromatium marinum TaxID=48729 RepID=UPI00190430F8|nr:toll/interleukin-1 receptor domain-containing protein [Rhabdochromatium marinum]MBK1648555.1 hypothetical protein [Rhabdochromatium marinum]